MQTKKLQIHIKLSNAINDKNHNQIARLLLYTNATDKQMDKAFELIEIYKERGIRPHNVKTAL